MNLASKSRLFAYTAATKQQLRQMVLAFQPFIGTDVIYLVKGGSWLSLGEVATSGSSLLWAIAFASFVPIEVYGTYKYLMAVLAVFSLFTLTGMNKAVTQAAARGYEGSLLPALGTKIRWGLLGLAASLLMSGYYFAVNNPALRRPTKKRVLRRDSARDSSRSRYCSGRRTWTSRIRTTSSSGPAA